MRVVGHRREEAAKAFDVLLRGVGEVLEQVRDADLHDASLDDVVLEKLPDENYVAQHPPLLGLANVLSAVVIRLQAFLELELQGEYPLMRGFLACTARWFHSAQRDAGHLTLGEQHKTEFGSGVLSVDLLDLR